MITEINYILRDANGRVIENRTLPAGQALAAIARFVRLTATDPDCGGVAASCGSVSFTPGKPVPAPNISVETLLRDINGLADMEDVNDKDELGAALADIREKIADFFAQSSPLPRTETLLYGDVLDAAAKLVSDDADYNFALVDICLRLGKFSDASRGLVERELGLPCPAQS